MVAGLGIEPDFRIRSAACYFTLSCHNEKDCHFNDSLFTNNFKEDFKKEVKWAGPQGHALETRIRSLRPVRNDSSAL